MKFRDPDTLTVSEAAGILGVSVETMRRYGDRGRVPMGRLQSGIRQFRRQDVELAAEQAAVSRRGSI